MAGATDFQDADVVDTIYDYGFQDNTPGQIMYGIDWDGLMDAILLECMGHPNFHLHLDTPIHKVIHKDIHKDIHKPIHKYMINDTWHVDVIFWTAPRPSWGVIPVRTARWKAVMDGVGCQSFLRGYSVPFARDLEKARKMFPTTTFFPAENPLQKLIPYRKDVYMIAYDDNAAADTVAENGCNRKWLYGLTGIRWRRPRLFYHECGTQFFRPLDQQIWTDRDAFLSDAQNPREGLYVCGEGLSGNQGWTEGALESAEHVLALFLHAEKPSRIMTTTGTDRI